MISRRNFLSGVVATAVGSQLIVEASNEDVQRFANAKNVSVIRPDQPEVMEIIASGQQYPFIVHRGQILYNEEGDEVGIVSEVEIKREIIDVTRLNDEYDRYLTKDPLLITATVNCFYGVPLSRRVKRFEKKIFSLNFQVDNSKGTLND